MFEVPKIVVVGKVEEVVLGMVSLGTDLDGTAIFRDIEFYDEQDLSEGDCGN